MAGDGGPGGAGSAENKQQSWLKVAAQFWNNYQNALPIKVDITADDVEQMLILVDIAKIAVEYDDGQP
jgi:hypothetical protein